MRYSGFEPNDDQPSAEEFPDLSAVLAEKANGNTENATKSELSGDRLTRSRERNRVHAQRTRQRKKEQMLVLKGRVGDLKEEQIRLRQVIDEKSTATILVRLFAEGATNGESCANEDPVVEQILCRSLDEIPDVSQVPELPALILPGQHASKKMKACMHDTDSTPTDGIDYELLGKDRSQCTPQELDRKRRERNRMHAKRTRDRKRLYTEKLAEMCRQLEDENILLHQHLQQLDPEHQFDTPSPSSIPTAGLSPRKSKSSRKRALASVPSSRFAFDDQISTLLKAAEKTPDVHEISDAASAEGDEVAPARKRQRF